MGGIIGHQHYNSQIFILDCKGKGHQNCILQQNKREKIGVNLVEKVSQLTGHPQQEIAALASILTASITYLVMLEDFCPVYNGIPLNNDSGWKQISEGIEVLINKVFHDEH